MAGLLSRALCWRALPRTWVRPLPGPCTDGWCAQAGVYGPEIGCFYRRFVARPSPASARSGGIVAL